MDDRTACAETFRAAPPLVVGGVTLLPIERQLVQTHRGTTGAWCLSSKAPYAIVIRDTAGLRAVDIDGVSMPLDRLRGEIAGFDALLASI